MKKQFIRSVLASLLLPFMLVIGILAMLTTGTHAEHGFIPEEPGIEVYHDDYTTDYSSVRYYYKRKNLEVEVVNDPNGFQYAYTISPYEAVPLPDGMYVISNEIIFRYNPRRYQLARTDFVMVVFGNGRVVDYYGADESQY